MFIQGYSLVKGFEADTMIRKKGKARHSIGQSRELEGAKFPNFRAAWQELRAAEGSVLPFCIMAIIISVICYENPVAWHCSFQCGLSLVGISQIHDIFQFGSDNGLVGMVPDFLRISRKFSAQETRCLQG